MENCGGGHDFIEDEGGLNITLSSGASTKIREITLSKGLWIVTALIGVVIPSGVKRMIECNIGSDLSHALLTDLIENNTGAGKYFGINTQRAFLVNTPTVVGIYASSNGSDVVCNYRRLQAIKIS